MGTGEIHPMSGAVADGDAGWVEDGRGGDDRCYREAGPVRHGNGGDVAGGRGADSGGVAGRGDDDAFAMERR